MTPIGQLVIELLANTAQFRTDLDKANRAAHATARGIQTSFEGVSGAVGGLTRAMSTLRGALALGGLAVLVKGAVDAGASVSEMATRVGVSTTALQELSYAARQSGSNVEELERGLTALNKNLAEAQAGNKEAIESFRRIGVDPTKFRDAGEAIGAVADGILKLGTHAEQTRARLELFDRAGNRLAGTLNEGSAGLAKLAEEARAAGGVMDATAIKSALKAQAEFEKLATVLKVTLVDAVNFVGPVMLQLSAWIREALSGWRHLIDRFAAGDANASLDELAARIVDLSQKLKELEMARSGAPLGSSMLPALDQRIAHITAQLAESRARLRERQTGESRAEAPTRGWIGLVIDPTQAKKVEELRKELLKFAVIDETAGKVQEFRVRADEMAAAMPAYAKTIREYFAAFEAIATMRGAEKAMDEYLSSIEAGDITINGVSQSIKAMAAEQAKFADAFGGSLPTIMQTEESMAKLLDEIESGTITYQGITQNVKDLAKAQAGLAEAFGGTLEPVKKVVTDSDRLIASLQNQLAAFGMSERAAAIYADVLRLGADATDEQRNSVISLSAALFDLREQQAVFREVFASISSAFTRSFTGVIQGTQSVSQAFANMGQSIVLSITESIINRGIKALEKSIEDLVNSQAFRQFIAAFGSAIGSYFGGPRTSAGNINLGGTGEPGTYMAKGGVVKARPGGRLIIAGEAGQDEAIIPLDRMSAMSQLGGGGCSCKTEIYIENNVEGAKVERRSSTGADGRQIERFVISVMKHAHTSGEMDTVMSAAHGTRRPGIQR